jgi:hypothetical protein
MFPHIVGRPCYWNGPSRVNSFPEVFLLCPKWAISERYWAQVFFLFQLKENGLVIKCEFREDFG